MDYKIPYIKNPPSSNANKILKFSKNTFSNAKTNLISKFNASNPERNITKNIAKNIFIILIVTFIILLIIFILKYIITNCDQRKSLTDYIFSWNKDPCINAKPPMTYAPNILENHKEVFHINNQDYTYEEAKCKCAAYGGRLATKNEIIEAYNKGADWCTYGWSEGQTAYYPTQKCNWDKLQRGPWWNRFNCGMPGVNGGFFANPNLKFGINCYGKKPKGTLVKEKKPICTDKQKCKWDFKASHILDSDVISPFNTNKWSKYS